MRENLGGSVIDESGLGDVTDGADVTSKNLIQYLNDKNGGDKKEGGKGATPFYAGTIQEDQPSRNDWKKQMMEMLVNPKIPYNEKEVIRSLLKDF